jgi:broad specificity phosphatase PhoE
MLIAVRHGITAFNDNGGKGGTEKEKFRGWLPIPLTLEGMKQAEETADALADVEDVKVLYSSDVVRAVQSATEIGERLLMPIEPVSELRDWNLGVYVGKPVENVLDEVLAHIDTPEKVVKEGESYATFLKRCVPFLCQLVESDDVCIAVTHARVLGLLKALSLNKGKFPDPKVIRGKAPVSPAGIMIFGSDWKILYMTKKEAEG